MFSLIAHIIAYRRKTAAARAVASRIAIGAPVVANDRNAQDFVRAA